MRKYGIMPQLDYETIESTLEAVNKSFPEGIISTLELGVHKGDTSRGIRDFFKDAGRIHFHTAVDNQRDFPMGTPFPECNFIIGDSMTSYTQVRDRSQHFIFVDACHNYPMTMIDHLLYSDKLVKGGYMAFHDTGKHIPPMKDYQGMGDKLEPDMYISCRKAITRLGLFDSKDWEVVFDRADETKDTGGITVFKKMY